MLFKIPILGGVIGAGCKRLSKWKSRMKEKPRPTTAELFNAEIGISRMKSVMAARAASNWLLVCSVSFLLIEN